MYTGSQNTIDYLENKSNLSLINDSS